MPGRRSLAVALAVALAPRPAAGQPPAPAETAPRVVEFAELWTQARARSPSLPAAAAAVERAEAAARLARAAWLPSVRGQATATHLDDARTLGDRLLVPQDAANGALVLTAPLLDLPRWRESGRARDAVTSARELAADAERQLALQLGGGYLRVLLERRALEAAERAVQTSQTQLEIARLRRAGGVGTRLEEVRAERELRDNQGRMALGRAALAAAQEALGAIAGAGEPIDAGQPPVLPALPALATALADVKGRPDLAALSHDVDLARRAVDDGWLDWLPTVALIAQPFVQRPATPTQPARGWQAQVALAVPIFDGGVRGASQRDRRARLVEAQSALAAALLDAGATLRATATELRHREQALQDAQASARLADESLELARTAFREGAGTQVDLIEAERAARDAATAVAVATHDRDRARLIFLLASGASPVRLDAPAAATPR